MVTLGISLLFFYDENSYQDKPEECYFAFKIVKDIYADCSINCN